MNPRLLLNPRYSPTLEPATRLPRKAHPTFVIGFDTEYRPADLSLLSVQFAIRVDGVLTSRVYGASKPKIDAETLVDLLSQFLDDVGIEAPPDCKVVLVAHFAQAELGEFADPFLDWRIKQIGKAHHAWRKITRGARSWRLRILDLFAFFPVGLDKVGEAVGWPKIDEKPEELEQLFTSDRARFDRYAATDAEIALLGLEQLRAEIRRYDIDVLIHQTLSGVAASIFKHRFLTRPSAPSRSQSGETSRRRKDGWTRVSVTVRCYDGPPEIREAAHRAYHGGRNEAFVRGLVVRPVKELDAQSMYPHAAILQPLPNARTRWNRLTNLTEVQDTEGFATVRFSFPSGFPYPCLPVRSGDDLLFPRTGLSDCTCSEIRLALRLGADVELLEGYGFKAGPAEQDHDVGRYMREFLREKANSLKGSLAYETWKGLLNFLVGKFDEYGERSTLLDVEHRLRQEGSTLGPGPRSAPLRAATTSPATFGSLHAPEWAALILGRARALIGAMLTKGALAVSTDALIVAAETDMDCDALRELQEVGSCLREEYSGDAVVIFRARTFAVLRCAEDVGRDDAALARNGEWAVMRVARLGSWASKPDFAQALLRCLEAKKEIADPLSHRRLRGARDALNDRLPLNSESIKERRLSLGWDHKRRLLDRDLNPFTSATSTQPYKSGERRKMARKKSEGQPSRKRAVGRSSTTRRKAERLLREGYGIRQVARMTGLPKSTVLDLSKKTRSGPADDFKDAIHRGESNQGAVITRKTGANVGSSKLHVNLEVVRQLTRHKHKTFPSKGASE